ncbi:MAG: DUF4126 family protein [Algisphaera sp.]
MPLISLLIQAIGSTSLFASRAFVPAFAAAMMLRFGGDLPLINKLIGGLSLLNGQLVPSWFTSDATLIVLGVLAALEIAANKNADARSLLNTLDKYIKPVMAGLTFLGVANATDSSFVQNTLGLQLNTAHPTLILAAAFGLAPVLAAVSAVGTFVIATVRSAILGVFINADADDDTGIQKLLSWASDIWASVGVIFLILFPLIMIALIAMVLGAIAGLRWWLKRKEEASKVPCLGCGESMYRCAMVCGACQTTNPDVCDVGILGQSDCNDPANLKTQEQQLAEQRRCPRCATHLPDRDPHQHCPACQHVPFADAAFVSRYTKGISHRLPLVLAIGAGLSAIPVIGLLPGVIYYRMALVAPFRRYLPAGTNLAAKWALRIVMFLLIAVQWIPFAGIITVPAMALISFFTYRGLFQREVSSSDENKPDALPTAPRI